MHALEWIEQHGRYRRMIGAQALRNALQREKRTCTWCGEPVTGRRQTWCSDECVKAFLGRCSPGHIRVAVRKRDQGVCAVCGESRKPWEADHIIPVCEGGGLTTIENYRTLCEDCHRQASRELAGRRSKRAC